MDPEGIFKGRGRGAHPSYKTAQAVYVYANYSENARYNVYTTKILLKSLNVIVCTTNS